MKKMIGNLIGWLIMFGISCALAGMFGVDQIRMFFRVNIAISIVLTVICIIILLAGAVSTVNPVAEFWLCLSAGQVLFSFLISTIVSILIACAASSFFNVDFYMVFLLMSLGRSATMGSSKSSKKKNNNE